MEEDIYNRFEVLWRHGFSYAPKTLNAPSCSGAASAAVAEEEVEEAEGEMEKMKGQREDSNYVPKF